MAALRPLRTILGRNFSEGARRLRAEISARQWVQADLTRELDACEGQVSRWLYGDCRPSLQYALLIEDKFGIPAVSWLQKPKGPFLTATADSPVAPPAPALSAALPAAPSTVAHAHTSTAETSKA